MKSSSSAFIRQMYTRIPTFGDRSGGGCAAGGWGCWGLGVVAAGGGPSREPSALSSEPSAASQPASAPAGPNVPQVLPRSTLELKVRQSCQDPFICHTCPTFLDGFGAPKCKSCSKTRFERPNAFWGLKNIKKRRTRMPKCGLCDFGA